jgi:dienelactone hydrolase
MAVPASSVQAGYVVRLFYPSVGPATVGGPHPGGAGPVAPPLRDLAATALPAPVIVSLPGNGGWRWANASTATYLAQQGYVVLAIDDVDHDPPVEVVASPAALEFNYSSWAATLRTMRAADDKAHREAVRGIEALDALAKELGPAASRRLDLHRVGFWGYSFGAAAAAQAAILDSRVAAVANEDGSVFGAPARGVSPTPYLLLAEYEALDPAALRSSEPVRHNYALTVAADHHLWRSLAARPDHYGFILHGAKHENFSDAIFGHRFFKRWLLTSPRQIQAERAAYLLAFFDTYLRKRPAALLDQHPPPFPKTEALKGSRRWAAMADAVPVSADERWLFNPE